MFSWWHRQKRAAGADRLTGFRPADVPDQMWELAVSVPRLKMPVADPPKGEWPPGWEPEETGMQERATGRWATRFARHTPAPACLVDEEAWSNLGQVLRSGTAGVIIDPSTRQTMEYDDQALRLFFRTHALIHGLSAGVWVVTDGDHPIVASCPSAPRVLPVYIVKDAADYAGAHLNGKPRQVSWAEIRAICIATHTPVAMLQYAAPEMVPIPLAVLDDVCSDPHMHRVENLINRTEGLADEFSMWEALILLDYIWVLGNEQGIRYHPGSEGANFLMVFTSNEHAAECLKANELTDVVPMPVSTPSLYRRLGETPTVIVVNYGSPNAWYGAPTLASELHRAILRQSG